MQVESALRGKRGRRREMDRAYLEPTSGRAGSVGVEEASRGSADEAEGETRTAGGGGRDLERREAAPRRGGGARRGEGCVCLCYECDGAGLFDLETGGRAGWRRTSRSREDYSHVTGARVGAR